MWPVRSSVSAYSTDTKLTVVTGYMTGHSIVGCSGCGIRTYIGQ
jgi:hypothetical protein